MSEKEKLELYKTAIRDARYIFNQYQSYTQEAWECIKKIVFNPKLK